MAMRCQVRRRHNRRLPPAFQKAAQSLRPPELSTAPTSTSERFIYHIDFFLKKPNAISSFQATVMHMTKTTWRALPGFGMDCHFAT